MEGWRKSGKGRRRSFQKGVGSLRPLKGERVVREKRPVAGVVLLALRVVLVLADLSLLLREEG